jgi:predicted transcriptional regulator
MQDRKIEVFTEDDELIVNRLRAIGMTRKAAKVITYMMLRTDGSARDIEITTNLRQPEVSVGLKELSTWVRVTPGVKIKPHARPVSVYSLAVPLGDVVRHYFKDACKNVDKVNAAYGELLTCLDLYSQNKLDQK